MVDNPIRALSYEEEHARRKAENTVRELWYFLESQLTKLDNDGKEKSDKMSELKQQLDGYRR